MYRLLNYSAIFFGVDNIVNQDFSFHVNQFQHPQQLPPMLVLCDPEAAAPAQWARLLSDLGWPRTAVPAPAAGLGRLPLRTSWGGGARVGGGRDAPDSCHPAESCTGIWLTVICLLFCWTCNVFCAMCSTNWGSLIWLLLFRWWLFT